MRCTYVYWYTCKSSKPEAKSLSPFIRVKHNFEYLFESMVLLKLRVPILKKKKKKYRARDALIESTHNLNWPKIHLMFQNQSHPTLNGSPFPHFPTKNSVQPNWFVKLISWGTFHKGQDNTEKLQVPHSVADNKKKVLPYSVKA